MFLGARLVPKEAIGLFVSFTLIARCEGMGPSLRAGL